MKKNTKNSGNKVTTAERLAQVIIDQLEKGVSPWHKTWKGVVPQSIHGRPYRGINALLLGLLDYEVPRYVTFVNEFPMNAAGKILKYKMREEAARLPEFREAAGIVTA